MAVILLFCLALGLALVSWQPLHVLPWKLEALPFGLVLLVTLFGAYAISRRREIALTEGDPYHQGGVRYLDADTLADIAAPPLAGAR